MRKKDVQVFLWIIVFLWPGLSVAENKKKSKKEGARTETVSRSAYDKLFGQEHKIAKGFITLHQVKDKLYFEFPRHLLGKDMMLACAITATSDNAIGVPGQKNQWPVHVKFTLQDSTVLMHAVNLNAEAASSDAIKKALLLDHADPVIELFPVLAHNADRSALVFEVTRFFTDEIELINPLGRSFQMFSFFTRSNTLQRDMTLLGEFKSFPENLIIRTSFNYIVDVMAMGKSYLKGIPMTVQATRSLILLPEKPMKRRVADSRINYFQTANYLFSSQEQGVKAMYYANRWRLEPKDTNAFRCGELVEPVKPIVFYMDDAMPEKWRDPIKQGVTDWNMAFEKIGFKNAVQVVDYPKDDPAFDPDDIRYSCIRYAASVIPNAMGPSWTDPRSGEIINATIHLYHNVSKIIRDWRFVQTAQVDMRARARILGDDIMDESLRYVVSHEAGHCLGLMHNMAASAAIPTDSLRSVNYTKKYGTTMSIMDYARFNFVAQPQDKGVALMPPVLGEYDYYAIQWGYSPVLDANTPEEEIAVLNKWITEKAGNPIYRYGKQELMSAYDPTSVAEALSDDMIKANTYGVENLKYIMRHLLEWTVEEGSDYNFTGEMYKEILKQFERYIFQPYSYLGGFYLNETVAGEGLPLYRPVEKAKQKAALEYVFTQLADLDWLVNKDVLSRAALMPNVDMDMRFNVVTELLGENTVELISNCASLSDDPYSPEEYLNDVFDYVWKPTLQRKSPTKAERLYQTIFVKKLLERGGFLEQGSQRAYAFTDVQIHDLVQKEERYPEWAKRKQMHPFAISGDPTREGFNLNMMIWSAIGNQNSGIYFALLSKVKVLLQGSVTSVSDRSVLDHYQYLQNEINTLMSQRPVGNIK